MDPVARMMAGSGTNLFLIAPGQSARRLTFQKPGFLMTGLAPVGWSADGTVAIISLRTTKDGKDQRQSITADRPGSARPASSAPSPAAPT